MTTWSEHYPNERAPMKVCPLCHREFEPKREQHKDYCSRSCGATAKRQAGTRSGRYPLDTAEIEE